MKDEHREPREGQRPPDEGEADVRERGTKRREEDSGWRSTAPEDPAFFIKDPE